MREQWLAGGAVLTARIGVGTEEFLAGFISLGRVIEAPPSKRHAFPAEVWSRWRPASIDPSHADSRAAAGKPGLEP